MVNSNASMISRRSGVSAEQDYRQEANGHGYIVEIDPYTAECSRGEANLHLGRFRHEGLCTRQARSRQAGCVLFRARCTRRIHLQVRLGGDHWDPADAKIRSIGSRPVQSTWMQGTLYVARFNADGTVVSGCHSKPAIRR